MLEKEKNKMENMAMCACVDLFCCLSCLIGLTKKIICCTTTENADTLSHANIFICGRAQGFHFH